MLTDYRVDEIRETMIRKVASHVVLAGEPGEIQDAAAALLLPRERFRRVAELTFRSRPKPKAKGNV